MSRGRAALLLAGVFVLGVACGALGMAALHMHHMRSGGFSSERMERFVVRRLTRRLKLDEAQSQVLQRAADKARQDLDKVRGETRPRIESILDEACDELKPALRPEQQKELEAIRAEARERLRAREGASGMGPTRDGP